MRRMLIATIVSLAAGTVAYAQDPAPKPDANAVHPPTGRVEQVTPTMKAPDGQELHPPTGRVGEAVPPMKSTDAQSTGESTEAGSFVPDETWISRSVYSSDGKELGRVLSVKKDGIQSQLIVEVGGFLGLGTASKQIEPNQIQEVTDERIVLNLSEAAAKNLPAPEDAEEPAQQ